MPDTNCACMSAYPPDTVRYNRQQMPDYDYSTIVVTGPDAAGFLQGQLTADLRRLGPGATTLAAWCNPKGRVICLLRVLRTEQGFRLALPAELAEETVRRLTMFRFRSKVEFEIEPADPDEFGMTAGVDAWRIANLRAGIPEIGREQAEKFTPHMLNLDLLDAVSFEKGCYTGQEVVARTHYRGATKRRMLRFEAAAPVAPGTKVSAGERDIGEVLNAIDTDLLAVVPVDAADEELRAGDTTLTRVPLPYLP